MPEETWDEIEALSAEKKYMGESNRRLRKIYRSYELGAERLEISVSSYSKQLSSNKNVMKVIEKILKDRKEKQEDDENDYMYPIFNEHFALIGIFDSSDKAEEFGKSEILKENGCKEYHIARFVLNVGNKCFFPE